MRILELVGIRDFPPSSPSGSNIRHTVSKLFLLLGTRAKARDYIWGKRVLPAITFGAGGVYPPLNFWQAGSIPGYSLGPQGVAPAATCVGGVVLLMHGVAPCSLAR